jgi:hypothetical protein
MTLCKLLPLLALITFPVMGQKQPLKIGATGACAQSPLLAQLGAASGAAILSSYGHDLHKPWACTNINSKWLTGSILLRFHSLSVQTDKETAFSVLKVAGIDYIWVIPTATGMLEVPHALSDPHNIAAFDALLSSLSRPPLSASDWEGVGKLYMIMVGHKEALVITPKLGEKGICNGVGECTVAFSDRQIRAGEPYNRWTLVFTSAGGGKPAKLEEATAETVRGSLR